MYLQQSGSIDISDLRRHFSGVLETPGDPGYDAARTAWNLAVDQQPALVARAGCAADVSAILAFAAEGGLRVAPQGTGHGAGRLGPLEDCILLRTDLLAGVTVDVEHSRAWVQAGAVWSELLAAAGAAGLTGLAGSAPDVGVVGYALGGGIGWLSRAFGLCAHSLSAVDIVTPADGPVRCDADHRPELFWALRGGGGTGLGVVTAVELELFSAPDLVAGAMLWPWDRAGEVLHAWRRWTADLPESATTAGRLLQVPELPGVPAPIRGRRFVTVSGAVLGSVPEAERLLAPIRDLRPEIDTFGLSSPEALVHLNMEPESPVPALTAHAMLTGLSPSAVDALIAAAGPRAGSRLTSVELRHLGGALARDAGGALPRLEAGYALFAVGTPMGPTDGAAIADQLGRVCASVAPWRANTEYLNFADHPDADRRSFPPSVRARLESCRAVADPAGVMHIAGLDDARCDRAGT